MRSWFTLILILASLHIQASGKTDPDSLLANRQYFELRDELNSDKVQITACFQKIVLRGIPA